MLRWKKLGFTVVEVFLVITLLAIVAALMVVPVQRLVENIDVRPLEEVVHSTIRKAHLETRRRNVPVLLNYFSESNLLQLVTDDGEFITEVALKDSDGEEDRHGGALEFYRILPEDPKNDSVAYESEEEMVESILFHPSGACTPFSINIVESDVRIVLDPFSSEPVLREDEGGES